MGNSSSSSGVSGAVNGILNRTLSSPSAQPAIDILQAAEKAVGREVVESVKEAFQRLQPAPQSPSSPSRPLSRPASYPWTARQEELSALEALWLTPQVFKQEILTPLFPDMPPVLAECIFNTFDLNSSGRIELSDFLMVIVIVFGEERETAHRRETARAGGRGWEDRKTLGVSEHLLWLLFRLYDIQSQARRKESSTPPTPVSLSSLLLSCSGGKVSRDTIERFMQVLYGRRVTSTSQNEHMLDLLFSPIGVSKAGSLNSHEWTSRMLSLYRNRVKGVSLLTDWLRFLLRRVVFPSPLCSLLLVVEVRYDAGRVRQSLIDSSLFTGAEIFAIQNAFRTLVEKQQREREVELERRAKEERRQEVGPLEPVSLSSSSSSSASLTEIAGLRLGYDSLLYIFSPCVPEEFVRQLVSKVPALCLWIDHSSSSSSSLSMGGQREKERNDGMRRQLSRRASARDVSDDERGGNAGLDILDVSSLLSLFCRGSRRDRYSFLFRLFTNKETSSAAALSSSATLSETELRNIVEMSMHCLYFSFPALPWEDEESKTARKNKLIAYALEVARSVSKVQNLQKDEGMRPKAGESLTAKDDDKRELMVEDEKKEDRGSEIALSGPAFEVWNRRVREETGNDILGSLMLSVLSSACSSLPIAPAGPGEELNVVTYLWRCSIRRMRSSLSSHISHSSSGSSLSLSKLSSFSTSFEPWSVISAEWWEDWASYANWAHGTQELTEKITEESMVSYLLIDPDAEFLVNDPANASLEREERGRGKPGPLSNLRLLSSMGSKQLKPQLRPGADFVLLPVSVYRALVSWYGGGPEIIRGLSVHPGPSPVEKRVTSSSIRPPLSSSVLSSLSCLAIELRPLTIRLAVAAFSEDLKGLFGPSSSLSTLSSSSVSASSPSSSLSTPLIRMSEKELLIGRNTPLSILREKAVGAVREMVRPEVQLKARLWRQEDSNPEDLEYQLLHGDPKTEIRELCVSAREVLLVEFSRSGGVWPMPEIQKRQVSEDSHGRTRGRRLSLLGLEAGADGAEEGSSELERAQKDEEGVSGSERPKRTRMESKHPKKLSLFPGSPIEEEDDNSLTRTAKEEKRRISLHPRSFVGLENLGNTCYLNSALQCLAHTPPLSQYFISGAYRLDLNTKNTMGMQELLACILEGLSEDLNRITSKPYLHNPDSDNKTDEECADIWWRNHLKRELSIIVMLFSGQYKSTLKCALCGYESARFEPFMTLQLPLPASTDFLTSLTLHFDDGQPPVRVTFRMASEATVKDLKEEILRLIAADERISLAIPPHKTSFRDIVVAVITKRSVIAQMLAEHRKLVGISESHNLAAFILTSTLGGETKMAERAVKHRVHQGTLENVAENESLRVERTEEVHARGTEQKQELHSQSPPSEGTQGLKRESNDKMGSEVKGIKVMKELGREMRNVGDHEHKREEEHSSEESDGHDVELHLEAGAAVSVIWPGSSSPLPAQVEEINADGSVNLRYGNNKHSYHVPRFLLLSPRLSTVLLRVVQRRPVRRERYFQDPYSLSLFGLPFLLRVVPSKVTGQELYDAVWRLLQPFLRGEKDRVLPRLDHDASMQLEKKEKQGVSLHSSPSGIALGRLVESIEDDPSGKGQREGMWPEFPFTLHLVKGSGSSCSICPWLYGCAGCAVLPSSAPLHFLDGDTIAVDWSLTTFKENAEVDQLKAVRAHSSPSSNKVLEQRQTSIYDCIAAFTSTETIPEFHCSRCKSPQEFSKKMELWRPPPLLILHLKRFQYTQTARRKLNRTVLFPLRGLDIRPFVAKRGEKGKDIAPSANVKDDAGEAPRERADDEPSKDGGDKHEVTGTQKEEERPDVSSEEEREREKDDALPLYLYDLYAVVNHVGAMGAGHYTALVYSKEKGVWLHFNDDEVEKVEEERVVSPSAYILFYMRRDMQGVDMSEMFPPSLSSSSSSISYAVDEAQLEKILTDRDAGMCVTM